MTGFTPGPWYINPSNTREILSDSLDGWDPLASKNEVALVSVSHNTAENSRLIAASPDLLESAKSSLLVLSALMTAYGSEMHANMTRDVQFAIEANRAAIAKAAGG